MKTINLKFMLVGLFAMLAVGCGFFSRPPASDKSMQENFRAHEADFKKLASMFKEDNFSFVSEAAPYLPSPERGQLKAAELSPQRLDEYLRLFKQTGVIYISRGEGYISFLTQEGSDPIDDLDKSYVYAENPPSPLVDSLDQIDKLPGNQLKKGVYKKIADNWYIEFSYTTLD